MRILSEVRQMSDEKTDSTYHCSECGHITTKEEMEKKPVFESCHDCGARGSHKGYFKVWHCPNCETGYAGSRPTARSADLKGCNRCFVSLPENHLREAIKSGDVSKLERFLPSDEHSMFPDDCDV